jgi:hypothetical protein
MLRSLNSSANYAEQDGSGVSAQGFAGLLMAFTVISGNAPASCLWWSYRDGNCSCGVVVNNSCDQGMNAVTYLKVTMSAADCIFQANTAAYFIASESDPIVNVAFVRCVFDRTVLSVTGSGKLSISVIVQSSYVRADSTALPACALTAPSADAGHTSASLALELGIGLPAGFLVIVSIVIAARLVVERKKGSAEQPVPFELHFEVAFMAAVKDKRPEGIDKDNFEEHPTARESEESERFSVLENVPPMA